MSLDPTLVQLLSNGGFAALFIWLLWDTRAESRRREDASNKREQMYIETLPKVVDALERIEKKLEDIE